MWKNNSFTFIISNSFTFIITLRGYTEGIKQFHFHYNIIIRKSRYWHNTWEIQVSLSLYHWAEILTQHLEKHNSFTFIISLRADTDTAPRETQQFYFHYIMDSRYWHSTWRYTTVSLCQGEKILTHHLDKYQFHFRYITERRHWHNDWENTTISLSLYQGEEILTQHLDKYNSFTFIII